MADIPDGATFEVGKIAVAWEIAKAAIGFRQDIADADIYAQELTRLFRISFRTLFEDPGAKDSK